MEGGLRITQTEVQAEMESLLSLRRRSLSTNSSPEGILDPDLPESLSLASNQISSPPTLPGSSNKQESGPGPTTGQIVRRNSSVSSHKKSTSPPPVRRSPSGGSGSSSSSSAGDSTSPSSPVPTPAPGSSTRNSKLPMVPENFWLPAHLHPELAPQEFRQFIRDQTLARQRSLSSAGGPPPAASSGMGQLGGSLRGVGGERTLLSGAIGAPTRKKSTLSRQYRPEEDDDSKSETEEQDKDNAAAAPQRDSTGSTSSLDPTSIPSSSPLPSRSPSVAISDDEDRSPFRAGSTRRGGMAALSLLTISDLQKLEQIAAEAEGGGGGAPGAGGFAHGVELAEAGLLGRQPSIGGLRRSLSLNPVELAEAAAAAQAQSQNETESSTDTPGDGPISVPAPGQALRRSARTKIRKSHLAGDGGGHRFGPSRRTKTIAGDGDISFGDDEIKDPQDRRDSGGSTKSSDGIVDEELRNSADTTAALVQQLSLPPSEPTIGAPQFVSLDMAETETALEATYRDSLLSNRSSRSSATASTDGLDQDIEGDVTPIPATPVPAISAPLTLTPEPLAAPLQSPPDTGLLGATGPSRPPQRQISPPALEHPQPQLPVSDYSYFAPQSAQAPVGSMPGTPPLGQTGGVTPRGPSPTPSKAGKEGKKSGWARIFGSSSKDDDDVPLGAHFDGEEGGKRKGKKGKRDLADVAAEARKGQLQPPTPQGKENRDPRPEEDRDKSGSFFGSLFGKKKTHETEALSERPTPATSPTIPPQHVSPTESGMVLNGTYVSFYRLPINVERAVYRLSHIKLANPRRPLYEQVLISNLMFWYLSVINKPPSPPKPGPQPCYHPNAQVPKLPDPVEPVDEVRSSERTPIDGYGGYPPVTNEAPEPAPVQNVPTPTTTPTSGQPSPQTRERRTGLSKSVDHRRPGRSPETPVRQPQYDQQTRVIDQEYGPARPLSHPSASAPQNQVSLSLNHSPNRERITAPLPSTPEVGEPSRPSNSSSPRPVQVRRLPQDTGFEVVTRPQKRHPLPPTPSKNDRRASPPEQARPLSTYSDSLDVITAYSGPEGITGATQAAPASPPLVTATGDIPPMVTPERRPRGTSLAGKGGSAMSPAESSPTSSLPKQPPQMGVGLPRSPTNGDMNARNLSASQRNRVQGQGGSGFKGSKDRTR